MVIRYALQALGSKEPENPVQGRGNKNHVKSKKVSKKIGEYIDYEELEE